MKCVSLAALALAALAACTYTPTHEVRNKPEYIRAAIESGDIVEITTVGGEKLTMEVEKVEQDALVGDGRRIALSDIDSISKRSWKAPKHPCGGDQPLGCSIPEVLTGVSEDFDQQTARFHKACVIHDFCYRHGHATYGIPREECDDEFYENMKKECGSGVLSLLDIKTTSTCRLAANRMYDAVRRHGENHYRTTNSSYCEYRE